MNPIGKISSQDIRVIDQYLCGECYSSHNNRFLFDLTMIELKNDELDLNRGRFSFYSETKQEYEVRTKLGNHKFADGLEWIHLNVKSFWSFEIEWIHLNESFLLWNFENLDEALLFKLSI